MDFLQLNDENKTFWKRADSEPTRHPMKANTEIIWNIWLSYLSLFEEVQRYLDIL